MKKIFLYTLIAGFFVNTLSAQQINRDEMPKSGPTPTINIQHPKTFKLPNGLNVMVVEDHKLPRVNVALTSDRPPVYEGNIVGIGDIMADQLGNGTQTMSKDEFNKQVDFLGAQLNFNSAGASANMLSKYFTKIMALMADAVVNPKFSAQEVEKSKERTIEALKVDEKSAAAIANNVFPALTYGKNTAMGEFETTESIKKITLADVQSAYKRNYSPEKFYLVIVGDVKFENVQKTVTKNFGAWKKTNVTIPNVLPAKNTAKTEINIVDVPSAVQSVINVGNTTTLKRNNPDYFPALIANYILGGGSLDSRLNMNLREKNGFTYGAYSSLSTSKYAPAFSAEANVRNQVVPAAVKEFMTELKNIPNISDKDLEDAKSRLKGAFIMSMENPSTIANMALNKITENLPANFFTAYLQSIDKVTKADVARVAKQIVLPEQSRILVVGKAADFADELEKMGYTVRYFDKDANPAAKPEVKSVASDVSVATIGEKFIEAIGGKNAVEKIISTKMNATAKVQGMDLAMMIIKANGGKTLVDVSMMGNSLSKIVFDGEDGYIKAQGMQQPLPKEMKDEFAKDKKIFPELDFATTKDNVLKGIEPINGQDAFAVVSGNNTSYYSVATGLKIAQIAVQKSGNQEISVPTYYSDYKDVNGVKMPFSITQSVGGQEIVFNIQSYEFNTAKDSDFK